MDFFLNVKPFLWTMTIEIFDIFQENDSIHFLIEPVKTG